MKPLENARTDCNPIDTSVAPSFAILEPPGDVLDAALLALEVAGVSKFAFRLTVLPLCPFGAPGLGVFGTRLSNLHVLSAMK